MAPRAIVIIGGKVAATWVAVTLSAGALTGSLSNSPWGQILPAVGGLSESEVIVTDAHSVIVHTGDDLAANELKNKEAFAAVRA
jgi:hypothetical protein